MAQNPPPGRASVQALASITGRDFGGVRFPGQTQASDLTIAGARVWNWTEGDTGSRFAGASGAQRLLLQGDVKIQLGGHTFSAAQASVWIETLADPADGNIRAVGEPVVRTRQVAIYFDRVSDPGGDTEFSQAGDRLLVTGILRGEMTLRYDLLVRGKPAAGLPTDADEPRGNEATVRDGSSFVTESEGRLARHLRKLLGEPEAEGDDKADLDAVRKNPGAYSPLRPIRPGLSRPYEPYSLITQAAESPSLGPPSPEPLPPQAKLEPIFGKGGTISLAVNGDRMIGTAGPEDESSPIRFLKGENGEDSTVMLAGGVVVQFTPASSKRPGIEITASRAVVFLKNSGDANGALSFDSDAIKGIYLEGDVVAVSGDYTVRGPRVYYDIENQEAVMPEAVFWTYDAKRGLPLYVRAKMIRQLADKQWQAEGARLATTSFTDPVFSIGARSVTITQKEVVGGGRRARQAVPGPNGEGAGLAAAPGSLTGETTFVDAKGVTLQGGGVPFFYLPRFKGEVDAIPLRDIRFENSNQSGSAIKTAWDVFSTSGLTPPTGFKSNLLADWFFDRGPGIGSQNKWDRNERKGSLFAYTVPTDWGRDVLSSGMKKTREAGGEFRGVILGEDTWKLDEHWTLQTEVGVVSDENFLDAFFKPLAYEGREVTNSAYLKRQDDPSEFGLLMKGTINDFTPNQYLLQSQGYTVDKLPEATYFRAADDLLPQSAPGLLTWSSEYRVSNMRLRFTDPTLKELGFDTPNRARGAFGVSDPNLSPADVLRAQGYTEDSVLRGDTRQELTSTFAYGPVKFNPFVNGRITAYDQKFEEFNAGGLDEQYRYLYATGLRTSTELVRVDDDVDSSLFDLHRTRHIIEPNLTGWYAGSNVDQEKLPVYDDQVESLATGAAAKFGIDQTWQTQRGGPGRWRSVDVLKLNAAVVESTHNVDRESPIKKFFDYRPEYSQLGNFATANAAWQVTDVVALTGDTVYDLDIHQQARSSAGGLIQHSPDLASYAEVRYINPLDATYVNFGVDYKLTRRYTIDFNTTYDTDLSEFQSYNISIRRKVPEAALGVSIGHNNITEETSVGVIFEPSAVKEQEQSQRLRNIGR